MKKLVILLVIAGIGVAVWKFWPEIKEEVAKRTNQDANAAADGKPDGGSGAAGPGGDGDPAPAEPSTPVAPSEGSGDNTAPEGGIPAAKKFEVELTLNLVASEGGDPIFQGKTNLPSRTTFRFAFGSAVDVPDDVPELAMVDDQGVFTSPAIGLLATEKTVRISMYPDDQPIEVSTALDALGDLSGEFAQEADGRTVVRAFTKIYPAKSRLSTRRRTIPLPLVAREDQLD